MICYLTLAIPMIAGVILIILLVAHRNERKKKW